MAEASNLMLVTVHPEHVSPIALRKINTVIVVGREPQKLIHEFAAIASLPPPEFPARDLGRGEALLWLIDAGRITKVKLEPSRHEHHRHCRKYAEGQLEPERVFHFRGPEGKLDLRAHNLNTFVQLADGVDIDTWLFHRDRGDYSTWVRNAIKDPELADEVERIEKDSSLGDRESRDRIKNAVLQRYTAPA
jgi:hypothetical protein